MIINSRKSKIICIAATVILLVSLSFTTLQDREFQIVKNLDIFFSLFRELTLYYVDETDPEELVDSGIKGMLKTLDPYTTFISESEMEDFKSVTTGQYGGVGMTVRNIDDSMTVTEILHGNSADKAGFRVGDILVGIDGEPLTLKSEDDVNDMLNGVPNSKLSVAYLQYKTKREITVELTRETVAIPNVPYYGTLDDANKIGYIMLSGFYSDAGKDVKKALMSLKSTYGIESLVLDLRNNQGGLLTEAVDVVNLFVKRGQEVVSTRGRIKQWDNIYITRHEPVDTVMPLAVVVNRMSASAAEIVAGAIQDMDRGIIVGQRTFGKGLVQATRPLSYNTQLKITVAKYYIPSGRCIQALDYTHREADGSVGHIPDSLIREYKTLKHKRTVRDGGGISPDVEALPETLSHIAVALYMRNHIFNYATEYARTHDTIPPAKKFHLTNREYDHFVAYLHDKHFNYYTETELALQKLRDIAIREEYMDSAAAEFDALQTKLVHNRTGDLIHFREDIRELLQEEIASRYYYSAGQLASSLQTDTQIHATVQLMRAPHQYTSILTGAE